MSKTYDTGRIKKTLKMVKTKIIRKSKSPKKSINAYTLSETVLLTEDYIREFHDFFRYEEARPISEMINNRATAIKINIASYRQLNSWDQYGLIDIEREGSEWRKYSILDAVWVNIIYELRCFGFTIEQLKTVKTTLEGGSDKVKSQMPLLEFSVYRAMMEKEHILLLAFSDGSAIPVPYDQFKMNIIYGEMKNHIQIDLNVILQRIFKNNVDLKPIHFVDFHLTEEEANLTQFIRTKNFERIEVKFQNGKMQIVEGVERVEADKLIIDILKEQKYQTIEIIQKDGKIVSTVRKIKAKLNNDKK